jgi:hypothetical protein
MTHEVAPAVFVIHEVAAVREAIQGQRYSDRIPIPIRTRIIAIGMLRHAVTVTSQDSLSLAACALGAVGRFDGSCFSRSIIKTQSIHNRRCEVGA